MKRSRLVLLLAIAVVCAVGGVAAAAYVRLQGNLTTIDLDATLGADRPPPLPPLAAGKPLTVLLIGSDTRQGENGRYGPADSGARSDTTMLVRLSADRKQATVVSIPRDLMVPRPDCGRGNAVGEAMFNSAFATGGAACTVRTVEALTGIRVDHFIQLDFTGFATLVDAVGGIDVTVTTAIDDDHSGLHLAPGTHHLDGATALAFVRTRHGVGDGGDLGRIQLQHQFLRAMATALAPKDVLSDPAQAYRLADIATRSMITDTGLGSLPALAALAHDLRGLTADAIEFATVPTTPHPANANRLALRPDAPELWQRLRTAP
ncbi:Cell envelope-associated transcriptional attenuator LytR-CpsA-Psr, subfamily A1 (as in PMID19099556) [Alloactinosynnema sp. L-07]|uniref:LCP family protein n=1 Tax=Alloactinosynnema sp. L-07 TaxID=1653480 RepID=UPI00065EF1D9|nr:LCP family protein [Alloactinosynnema sp. L-07]CRK57974.1 Cell envelope-associated transcriptional attenuator LytR-CpsA-Psr, subfamily A1 (as in PMID19099556) [Alloactinosynnema sp. L-07]